MINKQEILQAQKSWSDGVVAIGQSYSEGGGLRRENKLE